MEVVFASLSRAVAGSPLSALGAAFAWGLISVLLSPCHLASIPLIVGFMSEQKGMTVGRAFRTALLFSFGVLASIALIGVATAALGRMLGNVGGWANYLVAAVFFVMGLHLLGVFLLVFLNMRLFSDREADLPLALALTLVAAFSARFRFMVRPHILEFLCLTGMFSLLNRHRLRGDWESTLFPCSRSPRWFSSAPRTRSGSV